MSTIGIPRGGGVEGLYPVHKAQAMSDMPSAANAVLNTWRRKRNKGANLLWMTGPAAVVVGVSGESSNGRPKDVSI